MNKILKWLLFSFLFVIIALGDFWFLYAKGNIVTIISNTFFNIFPFLIFALILAVVLHVILKIFLIKFLKSVKIANWEKLVFKIIVAIICLLLSPFIMFFLMFVILGVLAFVSLVASAPFH
jgi:hypothetical protein